MGLQIPYFWWVSSKFKGRRGHMKNLLKNLVLITIVSMLTACYMPEWLTYTNATYKFQFKYPPGSTIVTDTPNSARIQLPITAGTNLEEKYLDVSADPGAIPCLTPYGDSYGPPPGTLVTGSQTNNGINWVLEKASEGGMGSVYQWTAYSTMIIGEVCVSLTFVLHSHQAVLYLTPMPEFNLVGESLVFQLIVNSFTMTGSVLPAMPPSTFMTSPTTVSTSTPSSTPTATPTSLPTDTPTPAAYFFIPKINSYCRLGPDPIFNSITLAMKGQPYLVDGRNRDNTWLYIMVTPQVGCWVPVENGSPSADTGPVRVLADIPTPTFTPIPFDCGQFKDSQVCLQNRSLCFWNAQVNPAVCQNK
jgi:hypothetical protein